NSGVSFEVSMTSMSRALMSSSAATTIFSREGVSMRGLGVIRARGSSPVKMVRGNIVENRIGQQIACAVAVADQIADQRGGDRQRCHVEGHDATRGRTAQIGRVGGGAGGARGR